jgi:hypothetical protein
MNTATQGMTKLNVKDQSGQHQKGWVFCYVSDACWIKDGERRKVNGWQLYAPDGCLRFCEGNWLAFVPFVRLIVSNYGCTVDIS